MLLPWHLGSWTLGSNRLLWNRQGCPGPLWHTVSLCTELLSIPSTGVFLKSRKLVSSLLNFFCRPFTDFTATFINLLNCMKCHVSANNPYSAQSNWRPLSLYTQTDIPKQVKCSLASLMTLEIIQPSPNIHCRHQLLLVNPCHQRLFKINLEQQYPKGA